MLEQPGLVILPWSAPAGPDPFAKFARIRKILDLSRTALLGFAGRGPDGSPWLKWWTSRTIEVFDGIDASQLLTIRRPAGIMRMWQVYDAEEKRVGCFYRHVLFDGLTSVFAQLEEPGSKGARRFLTKTGQELGAWETLDHGAGRLTFAEPFHPFLRMDLLAKVLTI